MIYVCAHIQNVSFSLSSLGTSFLLLFLTQHCDVCVYVLCCWKYILICLRLQDIKSLKVAVKKMLAQVVHTIYQSLVVKATQMLKEIEVSILVLDSPYLLKHAVHDFNLSGKLWIFCILHTISECVFSLHHYSTLVSFIIAWQNFTLQFDQWKNAHLFILCKIC